MKFLLPSRLLLLIILLISLPGTSAFAQQLTAEDLELLQLVQRSYENLQALESYHAEGSVNAFETISADLQGGYEAEASMDIEFRFDVVPQGVETIDDMNGTVHLVLEFSQNTGGSQFLDVVFDSVLLEGQNFSRVVESATDLGVPMNEWAASATGQTTPPIPLDRETSEPFLLLHLVNPQMVIAIEEQAITTVDGENVRVILLDLDPVQLRDQRIIYELGIGPENNTNFTASLSGVGALSTNTRYAMQAYIGEDGLPRKVEYLFSNYVTGEQQNAQVNQKLEGVVSYSNFDLPISIQNPLTAYTESGPVLQAVGTELENVVTAAYTNLQSLNSYRVVGRTIGAETITSDGSTLEIDMTLAYAYDIIPKGRAEFDDMDGTTDIVLNLVQEGQSQHLAVVVDNVFVDGNMYTFVQEADTAAGLSVPIGEWVDNGSASTEIIPDDRANSEPFLFYYLVDPLTIESLIELPAQQLDGQPMQVFEVALDPALLRDLGVISATGIGEGTNFNLTASFDGMGQLTTETTYVMTVFIGENDNLPHCVEYRFDQVVTSELRNGRADQSIEGILKYSSFDAPITIENPLTNKNPSSTSGTKPEYPRACQ